MTKILSAFAADETGVTALEYGALVGFIGVALILVLESIGLSIGSAFLQLQSIFSSAASGTTS